MVKPGKLYERLLAAPYQLVNFRDFEKMLAAFGFVLDRTRGSHRLYVHDDVPRPLPVQPDGKTAKRYQVREFLDMIEEFDLSMDA